MGCAEDAHLTDEDVPQKVCADLVEFRVASVA